MEKRQLNLHDEVKGEHKKLDVIFLKSANDFYYVYIICLFN